MARRILSRITPASVIATIALFAALGGGYAVGFSGSGTVQKGAKVGGFPVVGFAILPVRSLTGIGAIGASCVTSTGNVQLYFRNTSGEVLDLVGMSQGGSAELDDVQPNGSYVGFGSPVALDVFDLHVSPDDGTKRPMAEVQVTAEETGDCDTSRVSVLVLNTEE